MRRRLWLLLFLAAIALGLGFAVVFALKYDPVLDRLIPLPVETTSSLYLDKLNAIQPVIGKKVIFPPGLVEYASKENLHPAGLPVYLYRNSVQNYIFTLRDYLNERPFVVGLKWKYDAAQDAIVFDFAWHRPASQSGQELVDQIGDLSPVPYQNLKWISDWKLNPWGRASGQYKLDPWRQALDELMSEPGNFPHAWKARLQDCCADPTSMGCPIGDSIVFHDNLYSHILKDADGKKHLLVLHAHKSFWRNGWSSTYYLFAADGNWEEDGIFEIGDAWPDPKFIFVPDRTTIEIAGQDIYDYSLTVDHGKLVPTILKNGAIITPAQRGVTPLRHLGD